MKASESQITRAGIFGLIAAILVGTGEFLLHFDALGRFTEGYSFMQGISAERSTVGHFFGVLSAPLYIIGFWHLMKMLEPAGKVLSHMAFFIMSYGIIIGAVWIGSRSNMSALVNDIALSDNHVLTSLYELRYENLLQITRLAVLMFSIIFVRLVLTGRTLYPRWMAILNPIVLILMSFVIWLCVPAIGIYMMPIALNVAFALLFSISIYFSKKIKV